MPSPVVAEADQRTIDAPIPGTIRPHPLVLGLSSALLLWSSFPPAQWSWLAWIALVPLFQLVVSERSRWAVYGGAWLGGFAFWLLSIQWVRLTDPCAWVAWVAMSLVLSLEWPIFVLIARRTVQRLGWPLMVVAPVVWVAVEYLRAFILTGFPWYYLAHSQHATLPLIQIADLAGALGLSFLIALCNAVWVELLDLPARLAALPSPALDHRGASGRHVRLRLSADVLRALPQWSEGGVDPVRPAPGV